jgi:hypothetical protein
MLPVLTAVATSSPFETLRTDPSTRCSLARFPARLPRERADALSIGGWLNDAIDNKGLDGSLLLLQPQPKLLL